jgi:hypothetical protein
MFPTEDGRSHYDITQLGPSYREAARPGTARAGVWFHMLAMSLSTLSSTERNGSLHSTVR